jgi:thioredoxin reductase
MSITLLAVLILVLALGLLSLYVCEADLTQTALKTADLADAKKKGSHKARLQYPTIDLSRCLGCGTCVRACPEDGVLELIHGQSAVIHGARCVGHGLCAKECPVEAIDVTLGDLQDRKDIPILTHRWEAEGVPGLFLAGEVTGHALIRTAISHGTAVADEVADRLAASKGVDTDGTTPQAAKSLDFCIVGAGPAGLAAALQAKLRGLDFLVLEQESVGGTVAKYPRRKLVMTQPVVLPAYGRLKRTSYGKEELMEIWEGLVRKFQLPIQSGVELLQVRRTPQGDFLLSTNRGEYRSRYVCLALGRRGTPRKLGVAGEELPNVTYGLMDAQSYQGRRILVVGGGDSAIEAALGLAEQRGNAVTLSYRKAAFFRIKARNETRLTEALKQSKLQCLLESQVSRITPNLVYLRVKTSEDETSEQALQNDDTFILAGGVPPFKLLEEAGVSFDPAKRPAPPPSVERSTGLVKALLAALGLALATLAWALLFAEYYALPEIERPGSSLHQMLRPSSPFGLTCGVLATLLIVGNVSYLVRRADLGNRIPGSLRAWMTSHVVTGILALLLVLVHGAMAPGNTTGGHAYGALIVLLITGAVGRYFYAFVPRAAQGKQLELDEIRNRLASESEDWERYPDEFGNRVREEIHALATAGKWKQDFFWRLVALVRTERRAREIVNRLHGQGLRQGLSQDQLRDVLALARRTYRTALQSAHFEDVSALLASWRFFHRWVALLMVLLAAVHITTALRYARVFFGS